MSRHHILFLLLSGALALTACSKDDKPSGEATKPAAGEPAKAAPAAPTLDEAALAQLIADLGDSDKKDAAKEALATAGDAVAPAFEKAIAAGLKEHDAAPAAKQWDVAMALDDVLKTCAELGEPCFPALKQVIVRDDPFSSSLCGSGLPMGYVCVADGSIKQVE